MNRRLLNLLTPLSLLLCVPVVALWVRSYWAWDSVTVGRQDMRLECGSCRGALWIFRSAVDPPTAQWFWEWRTDPQMDLGPLWIMVPMLFGVTAERHLGGIDFLVGGHGRDQAWLLVIPYWYPIVLFGVAPSVALMRRWLRSRQRRRADAALCLRCSYDLRATPGRCPECGTKTTPERVA